MANLLKNDYDNVPITLFLTSTFLLWIASISGQENAAQVECDKPFSCGQVSIYYPFWGGERPSYCASNQQLKLNCEGNQNTTIKLGSQSFQVLHFADPVRYTLTMVRTGLVYDNCSSSALTNTSLDSSLFSYNQNVTNITIFYGCPNSVIANSTRSFPCKEGGDKGAFYGDPSTRKVQDCEGPRIQVQVKQKYVPEGGIQELNKALSEGFEVRLISEAQFQQCLGCVLTNGSCGANDQSQFSCFCQDGTEGLDCSHHSNKWNWKRKLGIGVSAAVVSAIAVSIGFYIYYSCQKKKNHLHAVSSSILSKGIPYSSSLEDPEGCNYFGVHFFTYSELEEATNFFDPARELGDGGFGKVYFGKLQDGRLVAVKRMYENSCRRVEQFVNEVEILTGLHHQNLVSLYGCTSRHSRELVLVYEYIPNGTVADHLHGKKAKSGTLPWHIRMNIAIETANALVYLHASEIIHRDVKTNNLLLDNHFSVKVADFGLSRLVPTHATHISTAPQGTPGYVDPEYNEYYQLTDKSDVYSFGVVLIELISSMPAVDISRRRHEINLSNMAIKKIQSGALHEIVDPTLDFQSDFKVRKMINAVAELAFQCLQGSKDVRPSMAEVLNRLEDIRSDGKYRSKPEVLDISKDNAALLKNEPPPPSPDSNLVTISTRLNCSQ
ncbi:hypothetical protein VNO78_11103 [Psophocarpus tetragonolobus]|uniref:non-specific serine/threonine protein kinase n=1 Tax=Psophocarpus tetragonolobus TaxID=3891 RepID=A0AAN9XMU9_PSOTE